MRTYNDVLDLFQDVYSEAQANAGLGQDGFFVEQVVETLMDSFIEDGYPDFLDVLDAAYDDAMSLPHGQPRMLLTFLIDELMQYEF
tara:strand:- start:73 stop:330 length:258 start_codon:yes stop_codon:yes gene_type:complete